MSNESQLVVKERPKVPLAEAANMLADLCDRIDSGEDMGEALLSVFQETRLDLAEAVDRRIAFDTWVKGAIEAAKYARDEWAARARQLDMLHERFKENTKAAIESNPDLPYQGKFGRLGVQKSPPSLWLPFSAKGITPDMIKAFVIDEEYVKTEITYSIDTAKVKGELLAGKELPWAKIEQGTHLRIRK